MDNPKPTALVVGCQNAYLKAHLGQSVRLRLLDGKAITGTLLAFDTFTLHIQFTGAMAGTGLVCKHAIAYITAATPATKKE